MPWPRHEVCQDVLSLHACLEVDQGIGARTFGLAPWMVQHVLSEIATSQLFGEVFAVEALKIANPKASPRELWTSDVGAEPRTARRERGGFERP